MVRAPRLLRPVSYRLAMTPAFGSDLGVYVHIPFCERVCPYCDFAVVGGRLARVAEDRYVEALLMELRSRGDVFAGRRLVTVYLGGGTPSLLRPEAVARIIDALCARYRAAGESLEITLEVNPSSLERARLPGFRAAGVNRLSVGVQSFDDEVLRRLGRAHKAEEGRRTLAAAREAGFANISLDLIFAAPGGSASQLERDLDEALEFSPQHLSAYQLTVEHGTPFALAHQRGQLRLPDQDASALLLQRVAERAERAGLLRYELSSYARPGFESQHNQRYWQRTPVFGLGMGAWSLAPARPGAPHGTRTANARELSVYLAELEAGRSPVAESEILDARTARGEAVFLALRCTAGLCVADFESEFGGPPRAYFREEIDSLVAAELLAESRASGDLALTERGRMLADSVFQAFV